MLRRRETTVLLKACRVPKKCLFSYDTSGTPYSEGALLPIDGFPPDAANVAGTVTLQQDNVKECAGGYLRPSCGAVQCNNGRDKKRPYVASVRHSTSMPMISPMNRCHDAGLRLSITSMNRSGGVLSSRNERLAERPHDETEHAITTSFCAN